MLVSGVLVRFCAAGAAALALFAATIATPHDATPRALAAGDCEIDSSLDAEEQAFLTLINNYRAQNGRAPLATSNTLTRASAWKSRDMGVNRYFAHDDLNRTWIQRVRDCGYGFNTYIGENIAAGIATAQQAFDLWKNSSGHNANMLGSNYVAIGIGRHYVAGSPYGWYWTTVFGGYNDGWAEIAAPLPIVSPIGAATDTTPPAVTLRVGRAGRLLSLRAHATDDNGVTRVEFYADGKLIATDATAPYAAAWWPRGAQPRTIEARAYDAAGNFGTATFVLWRPSAR